MTAAETRSILAEAVALGLLEEYVERGDTYTCYRLTPLGRAFLTSQAIA